MVHCGRTEVIARELEDRFKLLQEIDPASSSSALDAEFKVRCHSMSSCMCLGLALFFFAAAEWAETVETEDDCCESSIQSEEESIREYCSVYENLIIYIQYAGPCYYFVFVRFLRR